MKSCCAAQRVIWEEHGAGHFKESCRRRGHTSSEFPQSIFAKTQRCSLDMHNSSQTTYWQPITWFHRTLSGKFELRSAQLLACCWTCLTYKFCCDPTTSTIITLSIITVSFLTVLANWIIDGLLCLRNRITITVSWYFSLIFFHCAIELYCILRSFFAAKNFSF